MRIQKNTSGNALWLILIAIFLLGGLTVLVTRTGSQTEDTGSVEKVSVEASKILETAAKLEMGVQTLISRGCSETELSFWTDTNNDGVENSSDDYFNPNAPPDRSCHLFQVEGAGLNLPKSVGNNGSSWIFSGREDIPKIGKNPVPELMAYLNTVNDSVCQKINKLLRVMPDGPLTENGTSQVRFTGAYSLGNQFECNYAVAGNCNGIKSACVKLQSGYPTMFYKVLLAR